jgi:predicted permease
VVGSLFRNPVILAAFAAFVVSAIPKADELFLQPSGFFRPLMSAVATLGDAQVPCSMLMLSGSGTLRVLEERKRAEGGNPAIPVFPLISTVSDKV